MEGEGGSLPVEDTGPANPSVWLLGRRGGKHADWGRDREEVAGGRWRRSLADGESRGWRRHT
jgi:hypothetical protein